VKSLCAEGACSIIMVEARVKGSRVMMMMYLGCNRVDDPSLKNCEGVELSWVIEYAWKHKYSTARMQAMCSTSCSFLFYMAVH